MFSRKESNSGQSSAADGAASAPAPSSPSRNAPPSLLSSDLTINGNLESDGDMQVDGTVEGDIRSNKLTISGTAVVRGSIDAESVVIAGHVTGQIKARHVTLNKSARVIADVVQERLTIEPGAFFEGNCRHFPSQEEKPKEEPKKLEHVVQAVKANVTEQDEPKAASSY